VVDPGLLRVPDNTSSGYSVVNISLFWTKHPTSALIGEEVEGATFELMDNRRRQDIDAFDVGFDTGEVVTAQQLEYSVQSLYKIPVVATARGVSRLVRLEVSVLEPGDLAGGSGGGGSSASAAVGAAIALILLLLLLAGVMVRRKREKQALDAADGKALEAQLPGRQFSQGKYLDPGDEALGSGMISTELGAPAATVYKGHSESIIIQASPIYLSVGACVPWIITPDDMDAFCMEGIGQIAETFKTTWHGAKHV